MNRRNFVFYMGAGFMSVSSWKGLFADAPARRKSILILDAMGEIRTTHPMTLIREVIQSGTNSVTVTLTDPKVYGEKAMEETMAAIQAYDGHIRDHSEFLIKATKTADIEQARKEGKLALFYMLQNTTPIQKDLERVKLLYDHGIRSLQLTYNYQNYVGSGCRDRSGNGLSVFGHELIERMNGIGMLVDTSHANMTTMAEAITASKKPMIISHTACQSVHPHIRNTTDENMRATAEKGGLIGISQIRPFITAQKSDNLKFYFDHIMHAVKVAGVEHVCIGSDRDHRVISDSPEELKILLQEEGAQFIPEDWPLYMEGLNGPRRMEVIRDGLEKLGFSQNDTEKIMGRNLYRLYKEIFG